MIQNDNINSPKHYTTNKVETIDWIKSNLSLDEFKGFLLGNVLKYISRHKYKNNSIQDIEKSIWYLKAYLQLLVTEGPREN